MSFSLTYAGPLPPPPAQPTSSAIGTQSLRTRCGSRRPERWRLPVGTEVRLVYDVDRTDRYGRTLAYLYRVSDGLFVNLALARDGFGQQLTRPVQTGARRGDLPSGRRGAHGVSSAVERLRGRRHPGPAADGEGEGEQSSGRGPTNDRQKPRRLGRRVPPEAFLSVGLRRVDIDEAHTGAARHLDGIVP